MSLSLVAALIAQRRLEWMKLIQREPRATQCRSPSAITAPAMSTARARLLSLLTLALLVPTANIAHAQDSVGDDESLDASAPDASVTHASTGGASSHSTSVAPSGFGGTNGGGTVELPGPDLSSCSCHVVGRRNLRLPDLGLLLLGAACALVRRKRPAVRTSPNETMKRPVGLPQSRPLPVHNPLFLD